MPLPFAFWKTLASELILKVKTDNTGTSNDDQFTIPLKSGETYDFSVDYDGQTTTHNTDSDLTLTFPSGAGTYDIEIKGDFPAIYFNNGGDRLKLLEVSNWGDVVWTTMDCAFYGCANMDITATDVPDTSAVTVFTRAWSNCESMTSFPAIDTSAGSNFSYTWYWCLALESFPTLDVSSGTNFLYTWRLCTGLTSFPKLDMSSAVNVQHTWRQCTGLISFPKLDMSSAVSVRYAWMQCTDLISFPEIDFPACAEFTGAWYGCSSLESFPTLDLSNMTDGTNMLLNTDIGVASWSALLVATEANNANNNVPWHGGNAQYNAAGATARAALIADHTWTITDGGPE